MALQALATIKPLRACARRMAAALWCTLALGLTVWLPAPPAHAAAPLQLQPDTGVLNAWDAITVLGDPSHTLTVNDVLGRLNDFTAPPHQGGSLGIQQQALWLRIPLKIEHAPIDPWVVALDYSSLREVDIYLARDGQVLQQSLLGYQRAPTKASMASRTPEMRLDLQAGQRYDVLIRIRTLGPMILPITVSEQPVRARLALREQMLQGVLGGLAFWLLLYSLAQWAGQRERLFAYYALVVLGSAGFSLQYFGIGAQFVWPGNAWMEGHAAVIAGLVALMGSFLFLSEALASDTPRGRYARTMQIGAAMMALAALAYLFDILSVRAATAIMSLFGFAPTLLSLPIALRRTREGNPLGATLLVAWTVYGAAAAVMVCLVQGWVAANFWTLHSFQFGATLDMILFLRVLSLRSASLRRAAREALLERDRMHSLAHTDALTGLLNRRSMQQALHSALKQCDTHRLVAVYLLDLDGFKPVNDEHGHDVGDELLIAVGQRLRDDVRQIDTVARLGGDEFIILAANLTHPEQAQALGDGLLQAFREHFALRGHLKIHVGLTIGYALAPLNGTDARELINQADAAMYQGKQAGKHRLHRSGSQAVLQA